LGFLFRRGDGFGVSFSKGGGGSFSSACFFVVKTRNMGEPFTFFANNHPI
jgi:hypothetical protein